LRLTSLFSLQQIPFLLSEPMYVPQPDARLGSIATIDLGQKHNNAENPLEYGGIHPALPFVLR